MNRTQMTTLLSEARADRDQLTEQLATLTRNKVAPAPGLSDEQERLTRSINKATSTIADIEADLAQFDDAMERHGSAANYGSGAPRFTSLTP